jgi:hypothetical protein
MSFSVLYPEDGDRKILRNVGTYKITWSHVPEDNKINTNRSENLKSREKFSCSENEMPNPITNFNYLKLMEKVI